jgi:eukaryotic-like serine/threonine-protein kinase
LQASVALAEAHGLGIVHRDLKPANLFWIRRADGQLSIKVLDFGISKLTDLSDGGEGAGSVTKTSAIMGSPLYMSPEQMRSTKTADAQSDIWALGVILYELFTGRVPFTGQGPMEIAINAATLTPEPPRTHRPELAPGLEAVVLKCLEKDRKARYRNVAELAAALAEFAPNSGGSVERIRRTLHSSSGLPTSDVATNPTLLSSGPPPTSSSSPGITPPSTGSSQPAIAGVTAAPLGRTLHEVSAKPAPNRFTAAAAGIAAALAVGATLGYVIMTHGTVSHVSPAAPSSTPVAAASPSSATAAPATAPPEAPPVASATPSPPPPSVAPAPNAPPAASAQATASAVASHVGAHGNHTTKNAPPAPPPVVAAQPPPPPAPPHATPPPPPKPANPLSMQPM